MEAQTKFDRKYLITCAYDDIELEIGANCNVSVIAAIVCGGKSSVFIFDLTAINK